MDAKKCDICSNFFVISKKINGDDFFATSMRLYDDRNDYINVEHKDYDICPICSKRILDFINCGRSYMSDMGYPSVTYCSTIDDTYEGELTMSDGQKYNEGE